MGTLLKPAAVNQIKKGTVLFERREQVSYICAVVKGSVEAKAENAKFVIGPGGFIGVTDMFFKGYIAEYVATEDSIIYPFSIEEEEGLKEFFERNNKDYRGLIVSSCAKIFSSLLLTSKEYDGTADRLYSALSNAYIQYSALKKSCGSKGGTVYRLENPEMFMTENLLPEDKVQYYSDLAAMPAEALKNFFGRSITITMHHIKEMNELIGVLIKEIDELGLYIVDYMTALFNGGKENLLYCLSEVSAVVKKGARNNSVVVEIASELVKTYESVDKILNKYMPDPIEFDRERFEKLYDSITEGVVDESATETRKVDDSTYKLLKGSLKQILDFGDVDPSMRKSFVELVEEFVSCRDKTSTDDKVRTLRRNLSEGFYGIYKDVFYRSLTTNKLPDAVSLFLNYGYMDERLLDKETVLGLLAADVSTEGEYSCNIYTLYEWLKLVYEGEKEPSKNEFDMEYSEMLRDMKKNGQITDEQIKEKLEDRNSKLDYEIKNFFRINHRVTSGQPSVFSPILYQDVMSVGPKVSLVTKDRMGQLVEKIRSIDFSVFYREIMYNNAELGIEKENQMLEVFPDIILFPNYGSNAVMWQDISCKRRNSAGRFAFPIMVENNLEDLIIKTCGRFRWELCRTMQGTAWNDVTVKSLTSEYCDYLQFYKKNRDLSEERKEKIKLQITKGKNNSREVFVIDYEQWIKSEAAGGQRLNKVVRDIMALYCPFSSEVRKPLLAQPAFAEAYERFGRENAKKVKEMDLHLKSIAKKGIEIPQELKDTFSFYKDK